MHHPWEPGNTPEEAEARRAAYQRLLAAARRVGMPHQRLASLLSQVATNEEQTRRFLADQVYHVPDQLLDDLLRVRLSDLAAGKGDEQNS